MRGKVLTLKVFEIVRDNWPIHASGVCRELGINCDASNISKIKYHFRVLRQKERIHTKKIDRALVAWPVDIEKLRIMNEFMKDV